MNKQIQEFEKQCWSHYVNGVLIDGHLHFDAQKFAELIVKECAQICFSESKGHNMAFGEHCGIVIKEHFGVE